MSSRFKMRRRERYRMNRRKMCIIGRSWDPGSRLSRVCGETMVEKKVVVCGRKGSRRQAIGANKVKKRIEREKAPVRTAHNVYHKEVRERHTA